jgi:hypothetical protein
VCVCVFVTECVHICVFVCVTPSHRTVPPSNKRMAPCMCVDYEDAGETRVTKEGTVHPQCDHNVTIV